MPDSRLISRNPVDLRTQEHELLGSLLEIYEDLAPEQVREKGGLFRRIEQEIYEHVGTEEALFYAALLELNDPELRVHVGEALGGHRLLEALLADVHRARSQGQFDLAMSRLRSHAYRHMEFEQQSLFPLASHFSASTLNQLSLEIESRQMRAEGTALDYEE